MLYPVTEIFYSIQGEGRNTGMPAWFIRLAGCNLKCHWCDTDHSINNKFEPKNILQYLKENDCKNVIITGGEPSIHNLQPLLKLLKIKGYWVAIETNGTNDLLPYRGVGLLNWVTVSPKKLPITANCLIDEIKLVWPSELDMEEVVKIPARYYYLQPMDPPPRPEDSTMKKPSLEKYAEKFQNRSITVNEVLKRPHKWRLSLQTQKILNLK